MWVNLYLYTCWKVSLVINNKVSGIYKDILKSVKEGRKLFAILIDPDKSSLEEVKELSFSAQASGVDYILVGSSILTNGSMERCINAIKEFCNIPVLLFPGNTLQVNPAADGILYLSLISGRNPDMLIGNHVISAPLVKAANLEIISTGYMLVESGKITTVSYMSNTMPIPREKNEIAACTAMAGEMLGMNMIYLEAGSGAEKVVPANMIKAVKKSVDIPLIVGGGICTAEQAQKSCQAGADLIVVGNVLETEPGLIDKISRAVHEPVSVG
ncbi:MAG: geranylgeranylglyceryl/heptaprenylglyceryl phosphate synthase [Flavobacteriales bacterium]|nr:geranylgeranylglyceryl/heptaprenylglyceryl phosphate synthase [Flavobacteriales bacterium]